MSLAVWKEGNKPTLLCNTEVARLHVTSGMHDWMIRFSFKLWDKCCKYFSFLLHILQWVVLDLKAFKISQVSNVSYFSWKMLSHSPWCSYLVPISNIKYLSGNILEVSKTYFSLMLPLSLSSDVTSDGPNKKNCLKFCNYFFKFLWHHILCR